MSAVFLFILLYFIQKQFSYERPKRYQYVLLPIYTGVLFILSLGHGRVAPAWVIGIIGIGIVVGMIQGNFAKLSPYIGEAGEARVKIKGGWPYLIGWILLLLGQLAINLYIAHTQFDLNELINESKSLMLEELFPFRKINGINWWPFWALSTSASVTYTMILYLRSPEFRLTIRRGAHRADRNSRRK
ncbi:hypothetical protein ESZ50_01055 [Weissella muntiaci]|uniref:Hydrophobic protein n=1 Tax=Weissella muntiaci TaxID=2508881 RepID=A0A6C2CB19_9LACO|nr:hypothetical protein [Weissella muntiaci]TYC50836.1 hypothetical protein ESZ50_01055 [Weissella muntiaci]